MCLGCRVGWLRVPGDQEELWALTGGFNGRRGVSGTAVCRSEPALPSRGAHASDAPLRGARQQSTFSEGSGTDSSLTPDRVGGWLSGGLHWRRG